MLARHLGAYANRPDVRVLALPRGGVPVAYEVAGALSAPLDVFVVRKLGMPGHKEYAIGAIAIGGVRVMDDEVLRDLAIADADIEAVARTEEAELLRRERLYRDDKPPPQVSGCTVLLIDDGLATGLTMKAAVRAVRRLAPARVVVAVPVAAADSCVELRAEADEVVCAHTPQPFRAVGLWYEDFGQTTDDEVRSLLRASDRLAGAS